MTTKSGLLALSLVAVAATSIASETVLIDKVKRNGGFEGEGLHPWRVTQDASPANAVEEGRGMAGEGDSYFRVASKGGAEGGHVWDSISQDIVGTDSEAGLYFTLSYDVCGVGALPGFSTYAQLMFFDASGNEVVATVVVGERHIDKREWTRWPSATIKAPADWSVGRVELRIGTLVRNGSPDTTYEALIDNVVLTQSDKSPVDDKKAESPLK